VDYFHTGAMVFDLPPSYNIAPTTFQPVIRLNRDTGEREIAMMRWGLIPSWHQDPKHLGVSAIIITDPNEVAVNVHTRRPAIVEPTDYTRWLTMEDEGRPPIDLLRPYDADAMKAWKVGSAVGNVRNNDPSLCIEVS
jgi:putative SOS response-associated peptidase YedK